MGGPLGSIVRVVAWLTILVLSAMLTVAVLVPRIGGATPYTVLTGSMRPEMPPGTLVVVRPVDPDRIGVGDVITYQLRSGQPEVVTHRVVSIAVDAAGERTFRTQGDANAAPDAAPVRVVQLKGVRWYAVPHLGRFSNLLDDGRRQAVVLLMAAALLSYAVAMFGSDLRDRRRPTDHHSRTSGSAVAA